VIFLNSPEYGATPQGASPDSGYAVLVNGASLPPWLAGGWALAPVDAAELGAGLADPLQALTTIASVPITASGDHLVARDMHSSSNGSLARTRRMRAVAERPFRARSALGPLVAGARKPSTRGWPIAMPVALAEGYAREGRSGSFS
jgi:hypothetical protein